MTTYFNPETSEIMAGTYVFGDPCYCFSHVTTTWGTFCDQYNDENVINVVTAHDDNSSAIMTNTAHGDGCYYVSFCGIATSLFRELGVDSGLLGLVPKDCVELGCSLSRNNKLGQIITLTENAYFANDNGIITIKEKNGKVLLYVDTN